MSLRDKLRRLRRETDPARAPLACPTQDPRATCGEPAGLESIAGPESCARARITRFGVDHVHGDFALSEVREASLEDLVLLTGDRALAALELESAVYLDTETTGLSGGAGTYVYMVGLGRFVSSAAGEEFEVWQGFLPGPEAEPELLAEVARRLRAAPGIVSFFGKSFDRHRLQDKMELCGVRAPFEDLLHLDLYHPCRRLYGGIYGDGRLQTMEAELCGVQRADDLPGSLAPAAWFDYLAGRPHLLEGVFRHNQDDVLSLVTLAAHLGRSQAQRRAAGSPLSGDGAARALGLSRSWSRVRERVAALRWIDAALALGAEPLRAVQLERAHLLRLSGARLEALEAYRELLRGPEDHSSLACLVEVAKWLEHDRHDFAGALECCRRASALFAQQLELVPGAPRMLRDLHKRQARLQAKLAAPLA